MNIPVPGPHGQRVLLWIGTACALSYGLSYVFLLGFMVPPSPLLGDADVVALYSQSNTMFRFGVGIMILTGAFFVPMSIPISIQIARMEDGFPYLALLQILTGLIGAWIFAWPAVLWGACAFTVERAPELTVVLHQLAWLSFVTPGSFFWMQIGAVGLVAVLSKKNDRGAAFPRWFGWATLFLAFEWSVPPTFSQMFWSGPFAWNGVITYWVTVVTYSIWLSMMMYFVFRALRVQQEMDRSHHER